ncbi:GNAT family N-acetyltransferase [Algoriphagus persicinus]|nr:N-acetyltransferase [Algoriphagus sp. E1-3-M2]MEB2785056.1 N-acetyltransferase [Algoriphagus sp. E1-3-M2]
MGLKLLNELVEYVREEEIKVIPLCPFAKAMFKKEEELRDVLN